MAKSPHGTIKQAQDSAKRAGLAVLASLRRAAGDLDRAAAWLTVAGFVKAADGYERTTAVLNPLTELIVSLFGPEAGEHARTAIGVAALPLNLPVVISAEIDKDLITREFLRFLGTNCPA